MPGGAPVNVLPMLEKEIPAVAPAAPIRTEAPSPEMAPTDMPVLPRCSTTGAVLVGCWMMEPSVSARPVRGVDVGERDRSGRAGCRGRDAGAVAADRAERNAVGREDIGHAAGSRRCWSCCGACWMVLKLVEVNPVASSAVQETALSAPVALTDADAPVPDRLIAGPPDGPVISPVLVTGASLITASAPRTGPGPPPGKTPWPMSPTGLIAWNGIPPMPMTDRVLAAPRAPMPSDEPSAASPLALMIAPVFEIGAVVWLMAPWITVAEAVRGVDEMRVDAGDGGRRHRAAGAGGHRRAGAEPAAAEVDGVGPGGRVRNRRAVVRVLHDVHLRRSRRCGKRKRCHGNARAQSDAIHLTHDYKRPRHQNSATASRTLLSINLQSLPSVIHTGAN